MLVVVAVVVVMVVRCCFLDLLLLLLLGGESKPPWDGAGKGTRAGHRGIPVRTCPGERSTEQTGGRGWSCGVASAFFHP